MSTAYQNLQQIFTKVQNLEHAMTFLNWDQMVMMPTNGVQSRANSIAELASIAHGLISDPQLESWFSEAEDEVTLKTDQTGLREMQRQWQQTVCLPADLVKAKILAGAKCEHGWRTQRHENDWSGFLENFTEVVKLSRQEATLRQSATGDRFETPYDALLDLHCAGDTSELINRVFSDLKSALPDLLNQVLDWQKGESAISLNGDYPIEQQKKLSEKLMSDLGFDFSSGRLDVSVHPFSTGDRGDQRITTRFRDNEFADALQATAHETGHASYEAGLPEQWYGLPIGSARNMCIHESQSLLFEKQIFLSRSFCQFFAQSVHKCLPGAKQFQADDLWQSYTLVRPSFIRVEADEVTYPLHVMLRYDIESALINGELEPEAVPDLWDQKMKEYLGLNVDGQHSRGCLQDIHWTDGSFGYFPSYTMGAVNGAQLFGTIKKQHPDWQERFSQGDTLFVREWLADNIWNFGSSLESQELMEQATGQGSQAGHLLDHLTARYVNREY